MFEIALAFVLASEGGYVNHANDKGGPTNMGITLLTYNIWRGKQPMDLGSTEDLQNLTSEEAARIYHDLYWKPLRLDQIKSSRAATLIFDMAVNKGLCGATKIIQRAARMAPHEIDGKLGEQTIRAVNNFFDAELGFYFMLSLIKETQADYIEQVLSEPEKIAFLRGWMNRTFRYYDLATKT